MWTHSGPEGGPEDAPEAAAVRYRPPENELPVALPVNLVLARTGDVVVALTRLQVHSAGLSFDLVVKLRPSSGIARDGRLNELLWHGRGGGASFLLGVGFADGRRATNVPRHGGEGDVVLVSGGGSGGMSSVEQAWWLHPLPPEGSLIVAVRCDDLGIEETLTELDGTAVRRAAERVETLWPWEPPPEETLHREPPPRPVPANSWFAAR